MYDLVLASGSEYRKIQLQQLRVDFQTHVPGIDESSHDNEPPGDLSLRLASSKAQKVKVIYPGAVVIGSDQVCAFKGQVFGKPGGEMQCREQLHIFSNNCIEFFTSLCVLDINGIESIHTDVTEVKFRELSSQEINRYIKLEQPFDCAGGFKVESLGLSLFESVSSKDPSALIGLPLIKLCEFLRQSGISIP